MQRIVLQPFFVGGLLLLVAARFSSGELSIVTWPANVTVHAGGNVSLDCNVDGPFSGSFEWLTYRHFGNASEKIYSCYADTCEPGVGFTPNKYQRAGSYGLNILGVDWMDGADYVCTFKSDDVYLWAVASVVVIDKVVPHITKWPHAHNISRDNSTEDSTASTISGDVTTTPVAMTTALPARPVRLSCSVVFGSPNFETADQLAPDRLPSIAMNFGGLDLVANSTVGEHTVKYFYRRGLPRVAFHFMKLWLQYAATESDVGKILTCTATTANPPFTTTKSIEYTY